MFEVEFSITAKNSVNQLNREAGIELFTSKGSGASTRRISDIHTAVFHLGAMEPRADIPLPGFLNSINAICFGETQFYYTRIDSLKVVLIYFEPISDDPYRAYFLFVALVISGRFNEALSPMGISVPESVGQGAKLTVQ